MKPVKAVDAAFLQLETAATPMHVGALFVLDPGSRQASRTFFRRFKLLIAARLDRSEVFTRRVVGLPFNAANPMWLAGRADLDYHVRRTVLPDPGSQHQLEECVADLHTPLMDRERPLWELHVIEGLAGGRVALYVKTHHAGLDGASAQLFLRSFVDTVARPAARSTRSPRLPQVEHASTTDLLLGGLRHQVAELGRLPRLIGGLAGQWPDSIAWRAQRASRVGSGRSVLGAADAAQRRDLRRAQLRVGRVRSRAGQVRRADPLDDRQRRDPGSQRRCIATLAGPARPVASGLPQDGGAVLDSRTGQCRPLDPGLVHGDRPAHRRRGRRRPGCARSMRRPSRLKRRPSASRR